MESIMVWLDVTAPRYWWQECDTYRHTTKQSESSMHTLIKELNTGDLKTIMKLFEPGGITETDVTTFMEIAKDELTSENDKLLIIKKMLPECFLQRRLLCTNYKTLRNIFQQRMYHRLPHWQMFIQQVLEQVKNPELLPGMEK